MTPRTYYICLTCEVSVGALTDDEAAAQREDGHDLEPCVHEAVAREACGYSYPDGTFCTNGAPCIHAGDDEYTETAEDRILSPEEARQNVIDAGGF